MTYRVLATVLVALLGALAAANAPAPAPIPQPPAAEAAAFAAPPPRYRTQTHVVDEGETAGEALRKLGVDAQVFVSAAGSRLDRVYVGDRFHVDWRDGEARPWRLRVEGSGPAEIELAWNGERYVAGQRPVPYVIETGRRELVVTSSLWEAGLAAGLRPSQIVNLARVFEYEVDFNTELVEGARIELAADTLTADDGESRLGDVRAARLINGGKTHTLIRYRARDGQVGWYAPDGTGARRPFLRSPLEFSRVTSGFSTGRFHPVLKVKRPHLGVDFGAPTGTPVRAVADGVVTTAGRHGGHGNFVELDHEGPYSTSYSHLSVISVRRGQKVKQGDIIGKVGATGLATGPHLHYQFMVNGTFKDPMKVPLPQTGSLPEAERGAFFAVRDEALALLDGPKAP